jgi:myo-inositol-1(or 4)-monophosphatase
MEEPTATMNDATMNADTSHFIGLSPLDHELITLAVRLAIEAGTLARRGRASGTLSVDTKSTLTDLVTEYDKASETLVVAGITSARPHDGIIGEEGTSKPGTSGIDWLIDPIDGTTNFYYDLPMWAVSIGISDADGIRLGVVFAPALGEIYTAVRGHGAFCNGNAIKVSGLTDLSTALLATGFAYKQAKRIWQASMVTALIGSVRDIRRLGAASIDLCNVACGRVDAYAEEGLGPWDLAAGHIIALEAGATATDWSGGPIRPGQVCVSTPGIAADLRQLFAIALAAAGDRPN